eukprot:1709887-Pleurochrysis_carterae.AAC.2
MMQAKGQLGARLHVQLDNTCGENKNKTVIAFLAWLVYMDIFEEAGFFCMMKGHTYTLLDQSFGTLIQGCKSNSMFTVTEMMKVIRCVLFTHGSVCAYSCFARALVLKLVARASLHVPRACEHAYFPLHVHCARTLCYKVEDCREIPCVWDFKGWLEPHIHNIGGFATGQFVDGMHEFLLRKDAEGYVRITFRQSAQSSTWFPEGLGYEVFRTPPPVTAPPIAPLNFDATWERNIVSGSVRQ